MSNKLQLKASDPSSSVWVCASAGTGKTKILTDRVLRLLIEGVSGDKILCLTYTTAAANEMQLRIYNQLIKWSHTDSNALKNEILQLTQVNEISDNTLNYIKSLYYKSLNEMNRVKIHTIHSFCQKILQKFPFEAGINPGFKIIDDITSNEILDDIKLQIQFNEKYVQLTKFLRHNFHDNTIDDIINNIISNKLKFQNWFLQSKIDYYDSQILDKINNNNQKFENHKILIKSNLINIINKHGYDINNDDDLNNFIINNIGSKYSTKDIIAIFINKDHTIRKKLLNASIAKKHPELLNDIIKLQDDVVNLLEEYKSSNFKYYNKAILYLAQVFLSMYGKAKKQKNLLDYDDLILKTKNLFNISEDKDWILYKLDGGIEHLLVDEAQDTSAMQWSIIENLIIEFYSGVSANNKNRTIFVVGDDKQSIFSFQGAQIDKFSSMKELLSQKLQYAKKSFNIIELEESYRSLPAILEFTHKALEQVKTQDNQIFNIHNPKIISARYKNNNKHYGKVELWSLIQNTKEELVPWNIPRLTNISNKSDIASLKLAKKIALFIKNQIDSKVIIPSTNLPATAGDFLILIRKRDEFTTQLIEVLQEENLPISGLDRINDINSNISIKDILSIAKFALNPSDDLNLAHLILSPIIKASQELLYEIATNRNQLSIWEYLNSNILNKDLIYKKIIDKLNAIIDIYKISDASNFFHIVLNVLDLKKILINDNKSSDTQDVINELLYQSYNYSCNVDTSLQGFIFWFESGKFEVKRSIENGDAIRIMTVHGSKGLQAPVVIICDKPSIFNNQEQFIWINEEPVYSISNLYAPKYLMQYKEHNQLKIKQEYIRLLYVALTRAQDHLVFCGYTNSDKKFDDKSWYSIVENTMNNISNKKTIKEYEEDFQVLSYGKEFNISKNNSNIEIKLNKGELNIINNDNLDWIKRYYTLFHNKNNYQIVSDKPRLIMIEIYDHLEYGRIFHKILEDTIKSREDIRDIFNHPLIGTLNGVLYEKIINGINNITNNQEFINLLLSKCIKTEVDVGIIEDDIIKIGRIDLLIIEDNKITIIDYKSDKSPSSNINDIPISYIQQLSFYKRAISNIYKNYNIICKILWLETGGFTNL